MAIAASTRLNRSISAPSALAWPTAQRAEQSKPLADEPIGGLNFLSRRLGAFDVLVGINLLREGLDIPECALVAILDADK
jgi:hypothetical protein